MMTERRSLPLTVQVETRGDGPDAKLVIRGYGATYKTRSVDLGGFTEEILPGAFDQVLADERLDVVGLFNHDQNMVLGRTRSGTMRLATDDAGLSYEINPPATRMDVVDLIRRGDVYGSSFAFTTDPDNEDWTTDKDGKHVRYIRAVTGLFDTGPVLTPAYDATTTAVAQRSFNKYLQTHRPALELPAFQRDAKTEKALRRFLRQHGRKIW